MESANELIEQYFKSKEGVKTRLKKPAFASRMMVKMKEAQIILINRHEPSMTPTERKRAKQVKAGTYRGKVV